MKDKKANATACINTLKLPCCGESNDSIVFKSGILCGPRKLKVLNYFSATTRYRGHEQHGIQYPQQLCYGTLVRECGKDHQRCISVGLSTFPPNLVILCTNCCLCMLWSWNLTQSSGQSSVRQVMLMDSLYQICTDVTKLKFEFDTVQTSNVFNRFEIRQMSLSALLSNANSCNLRSSTTDFICTETNLFSFSDSTYHTNYSYNFCSVMCYTVLTWTLILLTLGNNILLQSFYWSKPVHYVSTDNVNASIRIHIRIRRVQILTSFITSRQICIMFD